MRTLGAYQIASEILKDEVNIINCWIEGMQWSMRNPVIYDKKKMKILPCFSKVWQILRKCVNIDPGS
jgi:hypothetical protein